MKQTSNDHTLFVMLPEDIDSLLKVTESKSGPVNTEFARGYALYYYLFERRLGMTHAETIDALLELDYEEAQFAHHNRRNR